jgi:hypothetical protein
VDETGQEETAMNTTLGATAESCSTCDCGQDLDCCAGAHCPRCGSLVERVLLHSLHLNAGPLGWVA